MDQPKQKASKGKKYIYNRNITAEIKWTVKSKTKELAKPRAGSWQSQQKWQTSS